MKKVEAVIRKSKFSNVKKALHEVGVNFFSYWDVTGLGNEKEGHVYRGVSYSTSDIQRRYLSIVINDDFEEGETYFPLRNQKIKPEKGKAALFFNLDKNNIDKLENSKHAGLPPKNGIKWMCNVWVRQNKIPK